MRSLCDYFSFRILFVNLNLFIVWLLLLRVVGLWCFWYCENCFFRILFLVVLVWILCIFLFKLRPTLKSNPYPATSFSFLCVCLMYGIWALICLRWSIDYCAWISLVMCMGFWACVLSGLVVCLLLFLRCFYHCRSVPILFLSSPRLFWVFFSDIGSV